MFIILAKERDLKMEMKPLEETIIGLLGIEFGEMTKDRVTATMPVNSSTHQPYGHLHGGASVVLAESVAVLEH